MINRTISRMINRMTSRMVSRMMKPTMNRIHRDRDQSGYSMTELLVVVAIIGIFSLITVPQFMSIYRSSVVKGSMRDYTSLMRKARQLAVTRNERTRIQFLVGTTGGTSFELDEGGTNLPSPTWVIFGSAHKLDATTYFDTSTTAPTTSGVAEIDFLPNGSAVDATTGSQPPTLTGTNNTVIMRSSWKNLAQNQFAIVVTPVGELTVTATKWQ